MRNILATVVSALFFAIIHPTESCHADTVHSAEIVYQKAFPQEVRVVVSCQQVPLDPPTKEFEEWRKKLPPGTGVISAKAAYKYSFALLKGNGGQKVVFWSPRVTSLFGGKPLEVLDVDFVDKSLVVIYKMPRGIYTNIISPDAKGKYKGLQMSNGEISLPRFGIDIDFDAWETHTNPITISGSLRDKTLSVSISSPTGKSMQFGWTGEKWLKTNEVGKADTKEELMYSKVLRQDRTLSVRRRQVERDEETPEQKRAWAEWLKKYPPGTKVTSSDTAYLYKFAVSKKDDKNETVLWSAEFESVGPDSPESRVLTILDTEVEDEALIVVYQVSSQDRVFANIIQPDGKGKRVGIQTDAVALKRDSDSAYLAMAANAATTISGSLRDKTLSVTISSPTGESMKFGWTGEKWLKTKVTEPPPPEPIDPTPGLSQAELDALPHRRIVFSKDPEGDGVKMFGAGLFVIHEQVKDKDLAQPDKAPEAQFKPKRVDLYDWSYHIFVGDPAAGGDWKGTPLWTQRIENFVSDDKPTDFKVLDATYESEGDTLVAVFIENAVLRANVVQFDAKLGRAAMKRSDSKLGDQAQANAVKAVISGTVKDHTLVITIIDKQGTNTKWLLKEGKWQKVL